MFERTKTQPKLHFSSNKHLIINSAVLDPITTARVSVKDDLVLRQVEEGIFSVLQDGKHIVKHLDKLTTEHGYSIVLYSNCKERQINHVLAELDQACKGEGMKEFLKISIMVVKDRESYPQVKASELKVAQRHSHEILVAGYSLQSQEETEILKGISQLINLNKLDQNNHVVLDNRASFIKIARQQGWYVCDAGSFSLKEIFWDICQKTTGSKIQDPQAHFEVPNTEESKNEQNLEIEEENKEMSKNDQTIHAHSSDLPETKDQNLQNTADEQSSRKNLLDCQAMKIALHDTQTNLMSEAQHADLQKTDGLQHPQISTNPQSAVPDASNQQLQQKETKEDSVSQKPIISDIEFEPLQKPEGPGGSSFTRWFIDKETKAEWIGKCSAQAVMGKGEYYEYKEYLASQLYELLGVKVPKTILSKQYLEEKIQQNETWKKQKGINQPKLHIFSQFVPGFELLGKTFVQDYKNSSHKDKKELFCIGEGKVPLRGFGRVMAVAILTHDYDFIGNTGRNIGYVPEENRKYFEILKIDPGEALELAQHISSAKNLQNPLKNRGAVFGTQGGRIDFNELNEIDQKEFVQTLKDILEVRPSKLEEIFSPFFGINPKFRTSFEEFLNRRQQLLFVFVTEVRNLITHEIMKIERQQAEKHALDWGKRPALLTSQIEKKAELLRNKAQLEAFTVAENSNSKDSKQFQVSQKKEVFVGRGSELSQLKKLFIGNNGILGCAIVGGAGLGKSQLATEYIIRNQKEMYSETVWLHAEQSDLIVDQIQIYLETCHKMKFDPQDKNKKATIVQSLYQILGKEDDGANPNKKRKKTCIVFDNADSMTQIADYLPDKRRFPKLQMDIIITSRYKKWECPVDLIIEMQAFGIEDVKNYISACIPNIETNQNIDQLVKDLNDLIGGLPLALSLAVAYIQQKGMSISEFCDIISNENNKEFITLQSQKDSEEEFKLVEDEKDLRSINLVSTIVTLALADLRLKYYQVEPILDILAYLSPEDISTNLLAECWSYCQSKASPADSQLKKLAEFPSESIPNQVMNELNELVRIENSHECKDPMIMMEDFHKALGLLSSYSLITANSIQNTGKENEDTTEESTKISIHRLTQQVIRLNHRSSNHYEQNYNNVFEWVVAKLNYNGKDLNDIRRAGLLIPHAIHLESLRNTMDDIEIATLQEKIGRHQLYGVGKYDVALKYYEKALVIKKYYYGKGHPETAITLDNLGNAWGALGDYEKKKEFSTRALEIKEKHHGKGHPKIAITLTNVGSAWGYLGDYEKKKDLLTQALEIDEKHYGKDHPETAATLASLGDAWRSLGDYEKARILLTRALEIFEKYYGKDYPETGTTLKCLGNTWGYLGDYEKMKDLLTRALEIFEKHYGKDHPRTAHTFIDLGNAWNVLFNYEKATILFTQGLEIFEKHYGKDHPETGSALTGLGNVWRSIGDYEKATILLTRALEIFEKYYGKDHLETAITLASLGDAWGSLGDFEKKKDLLTRALKIFEKRFGKDHSQTAIILDFLGDAWRNLGDYEKGRDVLIRSLEIKEKHYGKDHPRTAHTLIDLGNAWNVLFNYEKATILFTQGLEIFEKHYGKDHPDTGVALINLGNVWRSLGDYEKAVILLTQAKSILLRWLPSNHLYILRINAALDLISNIYNSANIQLACSGNPKRTKEKTKHVTILSWNKFANNYFRKIKLKKFNLLSNAAVTRQVLIANNYSFSKNYDKQREYLEKAHLLCLKKFEKNRLIIAFILFNKGIASGNMKNYEEKKDLFVQALLIVEQEYGVRHPLAGAILANLGNVCLIMKVYEESFHHQKRAYEIFREHFGEAHRFSEYSRQSLKCK